MPPPLFVVGCPRSGTSLFAKLLVAAGLTTVADGRATEKYPSGYFEHVPLLMFHKAMERYPRETSQRSDYVPSTDPFLKKEHLGHPFVASMFEQAFAPVLAGEADFMKYPQLALSPGFLFDAFPDARVVALWRDPLTTVLSLARKEFGRDMVPFSGLRAVLLWNTYAYHVCRAKEAYGERVAVVKIDDVVDGTCQVDAILSRLGYSVAPTAATGVSDPKLWTRTVSPTERARVYALDRLATAAHARLGAPSELTGLQSWARRLEEVTDRCDRA